MAFNGVGVFVRLYSWVTDAANSVFIDATRMDNEMNGFATGLTNCLTKDGQSTPTANIPMGGFKITGLANGVAATDVATVGQLTTSPALFDVGNSGAGVTIDFATNGPNQKVTLTNNTTLTLSNGGATPITARLRLIQDGTGGRTITWAGAGYSASRWVGAAAATLFNRTASSSDFVSFYWDGAQWFQQHIGPVARQEHYIVYGSMNASQTFADNASLTVIFDWVGGVDPYSELNLATGVFTAKVSGIYLVHAQVLLTNSAAPGYNIRTVVTGATQTGNPIYDYRGTASAGVQQILDLSQTYSLGVGGTLSILATGLGSGAGTITVSAAAAAIFQITRIGDAQ